MVGLITSNVTVDGLDVELTVTVTGPKPGVAVLGTLATICVFVQLVMVVAAPPLKVSVLVPCEEPKLAPATVTDVPIGPSSGETPVIKGVAPMVTDTLSNVPVPRAVVDPLSTAKPTSTFCAMVMVWLDPICVQVTPSAELKALIKFPLL